MKLEGMYLSIAKEGMMLVYKDQPLCNYKTRLDEIYLVCKMYKQDMPTVCWNGDRSEWVHISTIEGLA
jgi:hypothetical protein